MRIASAATWIPTVLLLAVTADARAQATTKTEQAAEVVVAAEAESPKAHDQTLAVVWMQRSAEYRAACLQAFRSASRSLEDAVHDDLWTACLEQGAAEVYRNLPLAVVLDVDETVLDNTAYAARRILESKPFESESWAKWVHEQQAAALPGALAYTLRANELGIRVVYVTNRRSDSDDKERGSTEESDTRSNLRKLGFPIDERDGFDVVLTAGEHGDKSARRRVVAERFRILQLVGDNLGDFAPGVDPRKNDAPQGRAVEGAAVERSRERLVDDLADFWGQRWILVPNPAYGSFESVVRSQHESLREALRTQQQ